MMLPLIQLSPPVAQLPLALPAAVFIQNSTVKSPPTSTGRDGSSSGMVTRSICPLPVPKKCSELPACGTGATIVKLVTPGPAWFDHGPHPASLPAAHVAPAGQARTMPL